MDTQDLIRHLAARAARVRPLPRPWVRAALWLAVSVPYAALIVLMMSPRDDLSVQLANPKFLVEQAAALATAVLAAVAAFAMTVPGHSRAVWLLPLAPLAIWLGSLGRGCLQEWLRKGVEALTLSPDWACFPKIALIGSVPAIAIVAMLRRGAPLRPSATIALAGLAAAALGNVGLRLFHPQDASLMVLVWQVGSVAVLSAVSGAAGSLVLRWPSKTVLLQSAR